MTRLKNDDINQITATLADYNEDLIRMTKRSLKELAAEAAGQDLGQTQALDPLVAVIPMTCGEGIIEGFVEAVAGIISFLGFKAVITGSTDAGGLAEAVQQGAEIVFMADDERFVAVNLSKGKASDNGDATGRGYATGLKNMCEGLSGKQVLVLGAGPVGTSAVLALAKAGAEVTVYDLNQAAAQGLQETLRKAGYGIQVETDLAESLARHQLYFDATPAAKVIGSRFIVQETKIAAPGIPLGVEEGGQLGADCLLHDPLQIGVATMLFDVLS